MKVKLLLSALAIGVSAFSVQNAMTFSSGPPTGHTGAPGESTCTACHSLASNRPSVTSIISNIPASGYLPGDVYTVTVTVNSGAFPRFGFQLTGVDGNDDGAGTFSLPAGSSGIRIQAVAGKQYVMHNTPSSSGTWSFEWEAPVAGTGTVDFYVATYNGTGRTNSDIKTATLQAEEDITTSIFAKQEIKRVALNVYPNPVVNQLTVEFDSPTAGEEKAYLYGLNGMLVAELGSMQTVLGANKNTFFFFYKPATGTYLLLLGKNSQRVAIQ